MTRFTSKGEILPKSPNSERVNFGKVIGKYVDETTKEALDATWGTIRYAKEYHQIQILIIKNDRRK